MFKKIIFKKYLLLSFLLGIFIFSSCSKAEASYVVQIEPVEDIGTIYFKARPVDFINHPVFKKNEDLQKYLSFESLEKKMTKEQSELLKKVTVVTGKFSALDGKQEMMFLVEGDFKGIQWDNLLKEKFTKSTLDSLAENYIFYASNEMDMPSLVISDNKIYAAKQNDMIAAFAKMNDAGWSEMIKKELESADVVDSLKEPLFLISYLPPKEKLKEMDRKIKREMNDIPINFSLNSFEKITYGLGTDQDNLSHITTMEFSDIQDIKDIKGILIGFQSLYRLLARNIKPIVDVLDKTEITESEKAVLVKGSISPDEMDQLVQFTKKEVVNYQMKQFSKYSQEPKEDYNAKQKRVKEQSNSLSSQVIDAFIKGEYEKLEPLLSKDLKKSFGKKEFDEAKKNIESLGEYKSIKINYPYAYDKDGVEIITISPEITFVKDGMDEKRNGSMKFVEEDGKHKLESFQIY